ncbi:MAG: polyprenyl synthetase family protein [Mobilicoccus sp.]|nr:polyprenyl synthetase family protein [Mobilicoccus sp.]
MESVPLEATLAEVAALLNRTVDDVQRQWDAVMEGTVDDILAAGDLPSWIARTAASGGKQIRPVMCHWGFVAAGGEGSAAHGDVVSCATALELLHTFALIHDDVMDEAETRRGVLAAHRHAARAHADRGATGSASRYGESMAILLGDLAHTMADHLVAGLAPPVRRRWFELNVELIAGQREDLSGAATGAGGIERARRIARIKSGAYTITRPLQLGAACASAPPAVHDVFERYGREVGGVFATRDDLLGVWGDPRQTGKPSGDDLRQRKPTLLWVDAEARLTGSARALLDRVGTPAERPGDVTTLQDAMREAGVAERAEKSIADGVDRAVTALSLAQDVLHPDGIDGLVAVTRDIAWRTS